MGMTPNEALKEKNHAAANIKMAVDAIRTRKYPLMSIADKVKIYRKKGITEKGRTSNWMPTVYKVERIEKS